jgi:hypothetical protein
VPVILNLPLRDTWRTRAAAGRLKSHQVFDLAINGTR